MKTTICPDCKPVFHDFDDDFRGRCPVCGHVFEKEEDEFYKAINDAVKDMNNN